MKRPLFWKSLTVIGLTLLLLLPLWAIQGLVSARSSRQAEVERNLAETSADRQRLVGPLLALDYTATETRWVPGEQNQKGHWEEELVSRTLLLAPRRSGLMGKVGVEERYRGLYKARVFRLEGAFEGQLEVPAAPPLPAGLRSPHWGPVRVLLGVSDLRGVQGHPELRWEGGASPFRLVKPSRELGRGLEAELGDFAVLAGRRLSYRIPDFRLLGTQVLALAPVAEDNELSLESPWASPSFGGRFLPDSREVTGKGFRAHWQVAGLARDLGAILGEGPGQEAEVLSVGFVEPVNIYLQAERATKYGFLFVALVFAAFFCFELLKRLPIHPMQYLLVGLSLALFFLLLLSLSEHVPFRTAYGLAALASILLLVFYLAGVLGGWLRALGFGGILVLLYGVLYALLVSEDNALLMGSVLLFAVLGGIMAATRSLDWYGAGAPLERG
nr:cell envelope integrity protein CreD [uncultured Holophaga sp.]